MAENKIILFDINPNMCEAWSKEFAECEDVEIKNIDFQELECNQVVAAGNSYGWMTGGLDLVIRNYYGIELQDIIQGVIINHYNGFLPVGDSFRVETDDEKKPYVIYTPTMPFPPYQTDALEVFVSFLKILCRFGGDRRYCVLRSRYWRRNVKYR